MYTNQLHLSRSPAWSYASEPSLDFVFISELAIQDVMMYKVYNKLDPTQYIPTSSKSDLTRVRHLQNSTAKCSRNPEDTFIRFAGSFLVRKSGDRSLGAARKAERAIMHSQDTGTSSYYRYSCTRTQPRTTAVQLQQLLLVQLQGSLLQSYMYC